VTPVTTYTLQYSAGTGGSISGATTQVVSAGGSGSLVTAVAADGYEFSQWSDGVNTATRTDTNVTANLTVVAQFARLQFTVSYSVDPAGAGGFSGGSAVQAVFYGENSQSVTANANAGYRFTQWSDGNTSASRQEVNVTSNQSFVAGFELRPLTTMTYSAGTGGSISGELSQSGRGGTTGTAVTANADEGYQFVKWSDDLATTGRTDQFTDEDQSFSAQFQRISYLVMVSAPGTVTVTPERDVFVFHGDTQEFTLSAAAGTVIDSASGCGGNLSGLVFTTAAVTAPCTITVNTSRLDEPLGVTATAAPGQITVEWGSVAGAEGYNLYYASQSGLTPSSYASFENGTLLMGVSSPYVLSGLPGDSTWYFIVTSTKGVFESVASVQVSATVPAVAISVNNLPLNDTGILFCGLGAGGGNNLPCLGTEPAEQDALVGRDVPLNAAAVERTGGGPGGFRFSKIGASGLVVSSAAAQGTGVGDWVCTRDNVTGLMWENKVNSAANARHTGHRYSWYDTDSPDGVPGSAGNTTSCGDTLGGLSCNIENYRNKTNESGWCGADDWRVPSLFELQSIVNYAIDTGAPAVAADWFPHTANVQTWTSQPVAGTTTNAWIINFDAGRTNTGQAKTATHALRLVRGPDSRSLMMTRYQPIGEHGEIIRDLVTGLEWQRCSVGQAWNPATLRCDGTPTLYEWDDARVLTDGDFRAPTIEELKTLIYCSTATGLRKVGKSDNDACPAGSVVPTIYPEAFPDTGDSFPRSHFWSDTTAPEFQRWRVGFDTGATAFNAGSFGYAVRLVRYRAP
jgi:hypothetical protein